MESIRAVLFDLDGTLIESDDRWVEKIAGRLAFVRRLHRGIDPAAVARWMVMTGETPSNYLLSALEHLGLKTSLFGLTDRLRRARGLATKGESATVSGSEQVLQALEGRYRLAVVTTRARPEAIAFLEHSGLSHYFQAVVTRQDVLRMKPHPEPVKTAAKLLGVPAEACLMIGDTINDILAARRAGAYAIGVLSGFGERRELERAGADLILNRAADMLSQTFWLELNG
jgi:HAD superfamily hydrolase (TIGR01509 family)